MPVSGVAEGAVEIAGEGRVELECERTLRPLRLPTRDSSRNPRRFERMNGLGSDSSFQYHFVCVIPQQGIEVLKPHSLGIDLTP